MLNVTSLTLEKPTNDSFHLHNHDDYEIYLFLEGDTKYIIEGVTYNLEPYDIIIIRKHQMHRAFHNSSERYSRIVINVPPEFFSEHNCEEYERQFLNSKAGNKIDAEVVLSSGIYDVFLRMKKYSDNFKNTKSPIVASLVIELLYLINNIKDFSGDDNQNGQLKDIVRYINSNYTDNITLDMLQKKFFMSKYHICYIFKKRTGLTVHQYIIRKRITLVRELEKEGKSISEAASISGFSSYSSFYRAYVKEYGCSPRTDMKNYIE